MNNSTKTIDGAKIQKEMSIYKL